MQQARGLVLQSGHHLRVTVAEIVDSHSGEKVEIDLAIHIPQAAAFAAVGDDRVTTIGFHDTLVGSFDPVLCETHYCNL